MIIDFHTHCFTDELASSAIPVLAQKANIPAFANGTVSALKESMKNITLLFGGTEYRNKPSQTETINNWAAEIQKDSIIAFGSIHPKYKNWENEL